jgi:hypothetical protein
VGDVFVERVGGHLGQDGNEVRGWAAHESDEEQARVQVPESVGAVGEVVTAPQHPDAAEMIGSDKPDVSVDVDERVALAVLDVEIHCLELVLEAVGRAAAFLPADHPLLLVERGAVPVLDPYPDPSRHQIRTADVTGQVAVMSLLLA